MINRLETKPILLGRRPRLTKTEISNAINRLILEERIEQRFRDLEEWRGLASDDRREVVEECAIRILKLRK